MIWEFWKQERSWFSVPLCFSRWDFYVETMHTFQIGYILCEKAISEWNWIVFTFPIFLIFFITILLILKSKIKYQDWMQFLFSWFFQLICQCYRMVLQADFDISDIIWYYATVFICWNDTQNNSQKVFNQKMLKFITIF